MPASITLTVSHVASSTSFFLACLQPLNYVYRGRVNDTIGFGHPDAAPDFWITQSIPGVPPGPAHVAFPATSRALVHEFYMAAMKAGGRSYGEPALRDAASGYFSAAIIDFDGNSIEAVYRQDLVDANSARSEVARSVVSMTKSVTKSRAPTGTSSTSKARTAVSTTNTKTADPNATARSAVSKASSKAPTTAASAVAKTTVSRTSSAAPSRVVSRAPSQAPSRTPSQSVVPTASAPVPNGNSVADFLNEAKGAIGVARELVNSVTPSAPSTKDTPGGGATPNSHGPSDAIVGTLLGVAAGAALHYALSYNNNKSKIEPASAPVTPPQPRPLVRSETAPSYSQERMHYYYDNERGNHSTYPYAIEAAPNSSVSRNTRGQRLIEMIDHAPTLADYAPSATRPRRRSSFSGAIPMASIASTNRTTTTASQRTARAKMSDAPPTSYRAPTAVTQPDTNGATSHISRRTSSRSRASSLSRTPSVKDEGYASSSEQRSRVSRRSSTSNPHSSHGHHRRRNSSESRTNSKTRTTSVIDTVVTAIKNHVEPPLSSYSPSPSQVRLPPSRAATWTGGGPDPHHQNEDTISTHSKSNKTVIGKLTRRQLEKLEDGGRKGDITKSVINKVKDVDRVKVTSREVRPEDSVSQIG